MVYSNIASIDIKDFRCLEKLHLDFHDSPIICIQAGNDSGKSSAVKAIETIMYNDNERKNKNYIRTGTKGFEITVTLDDGRRIQRIKGSSGNIYRIIAADGTLANEWNKLESDVPVQVQEIFGLVADESTGELLNIRTCESLLLFALTKPSENHKIFYSQLKVDEISNAMNLGKETVNKLSSEISNSNATKESYQVKLRGIRVPDMVGVEQLKERIDENGRNMMAAKEIATSLSIYRDTKQKLSDAQTAISQLEVIPDESIELVRLLDDACTKLDSLRQVRNEASRLEGVNNVSEIPYEQIENLSELERIIGSLNQIKGLRSSDSGAVLSQLSVVNEIDSTILSAIEDIIATLNTKRSLASNYETMNKQLEEMQAQLNERIKQGGLYFDTADDSIVMKCDHCGEENRLQLSLIEKACEEI